MSDIVLAGFLVTTPAAFVGAWLALIGAFDRRYRSR